MRQSVEITVKNRIIDHGRGWCFTPMHFSDLGSDPSIRKALSLLQKQSFTGPKTKLHRSKNKASQELIEALAKQLLHCSLKKERS